MDGKFFDSFGLFVTQRSIVSVIRGAIIEKKDLVDLLPYFVGNPIQRPVKLVDGVVGNYEYSDTLLLV